VNTFCGFPRANGPPGIRNHVLVISGELSCNPWTREIASPYDTCWAVTHKHGIGNFTPDREVFLRILRGIMLHPNVAGCVLVASGNENYNPELLVQDVIKLNRKAHLVSAKTEQHAPTLIERARLCARQLVEEAADAKRTACGIDQLRIGLNCAGTDRVSAKTSHVVCASAMDLIIESGSTVVASEIPELIGLGESLLDRCRSNTVRKALQRMIKKHQERLLATGEDISQNELCAANVGGGLRTLSEKSRVSVMKVGTSPVQDVMRYGEQPKSSGLVFMDGPAFTDFVVTGYMGAGVHMIVNCCGAGHVNNLPVAVGTDTSSPILPLCKITGSSAKFRQRSNKIDIDAGPLLHDKTKVVNVTRHLIKTLLAIASGKQTKTELGQDIFLNMPVQFYQA